MSINNTHTCRHFKPKEKVRNRAVAPAEQPPSNLTVRMMMGTITALQAELKNKNRRIDTIMAEVILLRKELGVN